MRKKEYILAYTYFNEDNSQGYGNYYFTVRGIFGKVTLDILNQIIEEMKQEKGFKNVILLNVITL